MIGPVPGYIVDSAGKPLIDINQASLYGFGHFIRSTEQLVLDLFGRGLLSARRTPVLVRGCA